MTTNTGGPATEGRPMTPPELPALDLHCESGRAHAAYTPESVEARERILLDRIAELEADAARYRWLAAKAQKDTAYDRYGNGAHWIIGFFAANGRHALDAAIDAAREAKP